MAINNVNHNAFSGMQKGLADMQSNAGKVARREDQVNGMLGVRQGARQVEANSRVVKAADDALGKLIDEMA